jgi:hypothetical protein
MRDENAGTYAGVLYFSIYRFGLVTLMRDWCAFSATWSTALGEVGASDWLYPHIYGENFLCLDERRINNQP